VLTNQGRYNVFIKRKGFDGGRLVIAHQFAVADHIGTHDRCYFAAKGIRTHLIALRKALREDR
jgi:hypothetical protein